MKGQGNNNYKKGKTAKEKPKVGVWMLYFEGNIILKNLLISKVLHPISHGSNGISSQQQLSSR